MKKILTFFIYLITYINDVLSDEKIKSIIPDEKLILKGVKLNKEILLNIDIKNFEKFQKYKIMVHYIGSYSISFKILLICDDIYLIKDQQNSEEILLNDYSEFDFQTNGLKVPFQCGDNYDKRKVLLSLKPYSLAYQFIPENEIKFNIIVELISNINIDNKPLSIMFNKGLYRGIIFIIIIIVLIIFVFQNKVNNILEKILDFKGRKKIN